MLPWHMVDNVTQQNQITGIGSGNHEVVNSLLKESYPLTIASKETPHPRSYINTSDMGSRINVRQLLGQAALATPDLQDPLRRRPSRHLASEMSDIEEESSIGVRNWPLERPHQPAYTWSDCHGGSRHQ